jgi:hypothetical protein
MRLHATHSRTRPRATTASRLHPMRCVAALLASLALSTGGWLAALAAGVTMDLSVPWPTAGVYDTIQQAR